MPPKTEACCPQCAQPLTGRRTNQRYCNPLCRKRAASARYHQRSPLAPHDPQAPLLLTSREREVLLLILTGMRMKEVAAQLNLDTRTVDTYKSGLMHKLGVRHLVGLVKLAIRMGWTPLEEESDSVLPCAA